MNSHMAELSWDEVERRLQTTNVALVPLGSVEPHGRHAPLGLDAFVAEEIADRVAAIAGGLVFPPLHLGTLSLIQDFRALPGGVSIDTDVLLALYTNIGVRLGEAGFKRILFVNGHGPNGPLLAVAAYQIRDRVGAEVGVLEWWSSAGDVIAEIKGFNYANHADHIETSLLLATPHGPLVDLSKAVRNSPTVEDVDPDEKAIYLKKIPYTHNFDERWVGTSGNMGDPSQANGEDGDRVIEATVQMGVKLLGVLGRNLERRSAG
jgi:creatinine amidohydrolase